MTTNRKQLRIHVGDMFVAEAPNRGCAIFLDTCTLYESDQNRNRFSSIVTDLDIKWEAATPLTFLVVSDTVPTVREVESFFMRVGARVIRDGEVWFEVV